MMKFSSFSHRSLVFKPSPIDTKHLLTLSIKDPYVFVRRAEE